MDNKSLVTWADYHPEVVQATSNRISWPCERFPTALGPCSQPTLVKGPDEELMVECQRHGSDNIAGILHSTDGGVSWRRLCDVPLKCQVPDGYKSTTTSPSALGMGLLGGGTILFSYRLWYNDGSGKFGPCDQDDPSCHHRVCIVRSSDRGRTWDAPVELDPSPFEAIGGNKVRFHQMPDGTVLLPMNCTRYARPGKPLGPDDKYEMAQVYMSNDKGRAWSKCGDVGMHSDETDLLPLPSGRILASTRFQRSKKTSDPADLGTPYALDAAHRQRSPQCRNCANPTQVGGHSIYKQMAFCHSDDGGKSFSEHRLLTAWLQQTGCLIRLSDGTVIMPFSHKDDGQGQRFMVSYDDGQTWCKATFELHVGGMYASSVVLADDTIVTAYAAEPHSGGQSMLEVLRWKAPPRDVVARNGFFRPRPVH